jgi:2,3-bisphosphoglycerate-independent phosphoglycerate mutase
MTTSPPIVLCILDGVGWGRRDDGDAFFTAETPILDALLAERPWCLLQAHGTAVGMPSDDDMGNSEVGHNAIGAGRIFAQGAKLVRAAVASGAIWESAAWAEVTSGGTLHLLGLVSDGNVHSHIDHLRAMVDQAHAAGVKRLRVHALTDGRDVAARSALDWIGPLEEALAALDDVDYAIATGGGRMHMTMDRYEADWEMVKRGYDTHVHAQGRRFPSATAAIKALYDEDPATDDQWLPAFVVGDYDGMKDGDAVIFFNFRGDRAIEISRAFEDDDFPHFDRGDRPDIRYAGMMEYDGDLHIPKRYLVAPPEISDTVGERMSAAGQKIFSISETQKFGHVTYFINGNRSAPLPGETQAQVPSFNVPFNQKPEMSAAAVTDRVVAAIQSGEHNHLRLNIANGDMVGHTGDFEAALAAMAVVDACVGRLVEAVEAAGGTMIITADHGNVEEMFLLDKKTGAYKTDAAGRRSSSTSHSLNPVPVILVDASGQWALVRPERDAAVVGGIAQLGGTLLVLSGLAVPEHYLPAIVERR